MNYNFDDERKKIDDDLSIYNQALNDLISRQQNDEQKILNDQDLGSRALRIFRVAKNGGDTSNIYNEYKQDLNTKLQNNSNKYKQMRDELLQKSKDTLARRDALDKFKYSMEQDQIKNDLANREFGLRTKTQADQNAIQQAQLDILRGQANAKTAQAQQDLLDAEKKQEEEKTQLESDLANLFDTYNAKSSGWTKPLGIFQTSGEEKSSARINDINLKAAKVKFGLEGKEAVDFIKNNPDLFLSDKDSGDVNEEKARILGLDPRRKYNGLRINGSKDVIKNGKKIRIYELDNGDGTTTMAQEEIK